MYYIRTEFWDLYDLKMNRVGKIRRGAQIPGGLYHLCVEVIPTDMKGHILITQRSLGKKFGAGKYEFPAGSVMSEESAAVAALRELREETGLNASKLMLFQTEKTPYKSDTSGIIRNTYVALVEDLTERQVTLQVSETINYKIITVDTLFTEYIDKGLFDESRLQLLGDFRERLQAIVGIPPEGEQGGQQFLNGPIQDIRPQIRLIKRQVGNLSGTLRRNNE